MADLDYKLRSGGAIGCDSAFDYLYRSDSEIYLAQEKDKLKFKRPTIVVPFVEGDEAFEIAASVHGNWNACSGYAKMLHRRNVFQVLGAKLDNPSKLLICWTPCGAESARECVFSKTGLNTGGTATAIKIADKFNVPIINIQRNTWKDKIKDVLNL